MKREIGYCPSNVSTLHGNYIVLQDDWYGLHEGCQYCGYEIKLRKDAKGNIIEQDKYTKFHAADFVQRDDTELFNMIYGEGQAEKTKKEVEHIAKKKKEKLVFDEEIKEAKEYKKEIQSGKLTIGMYG